MKVCSYCGRENEESSATCRECGTDLNPVEPEGFSRTGMRRILIAVGLIVLVAVISMPSSVLIIPVLTVFYAPLYLPFILSFLLKDPDWRGMRWSLRIASIVALFIWLTAPRPDFGGDVGGNIAGASHNFVWTWGNGMGCALAAIVVGLALHAIHRKRS